MDAVSNRLPANGPLSFHRGTEERLLQVVQRAVANDPLDLPTVDSAVVNPAERVLDATDRFCWGEHWMMLVGDIKGQVVDAALRERVLAASDSSHRGKSTRASTRFVALELGTYVGYSAVRIARLLPAGGVLYTCDFDAAAHAVASRMVTLAGLQERVRFVTSTAEEATRQLQAEDVKLDFVFIDHDKADYLQALRRLEATDILHDGAVVVADNVDVFHIVDYLAHVRDSGLYDSYHVDAALEYSSAGTESSAGIPDGVEVSTFRSRSFLDDEL